MLRTTRERIAQAVAYEVGWILLAAPLYAFLFNQSAMQSTALVLALSAVTIAWSPIHNALFDIAEWRLCARIASDRPTLLRLVHAFSLEASSIVVTAPVIMVVGGHGLLEAIAIDIGLTILDTIYAYAFHFAYDKARPVRVNRVTAASEQRQSYP